MDIDMTIYGKYHNQGFRPRDLTQLKVCDLSYKTNHFKLLIGHPFFF